jgi:pre-mRNA-processing factor 6
MKARTTIIGATNVLRFDFQSARAAHAAGIKAVPKHMKARLVNPKSDALWAEAVRVEELSGVPAQGKALLARALQESPTSGILWSMEIWSEARPQRKARSVDTLRKCEADPLVIYTVVRL